MNMENKQNKTECKNKTNKLKLLKIIVRAVICFIILFIGISLFNLLASMKHKPQEKSSEKLMKTLITIPVKVEDYSIDVIGYGTIEPRRTITVSSLLKGLVVDVNPDLYDGLLVEKGEILAEIDKTDYVIALNKANADLKIIEANEAVQKQDIEDGKEILKTIKNQYKLVEQDYQRHVGMFEKHVVSKQALESAEQTLSEYKNSFLQMQSNLRKTEIELESIIASHERAVAVKAQAESNLKRSTIKAPISGRLKDVNLNKGEYVTLGTVLFDIADDTFLIIPVPLNTEDASAILDITPDNTKSYRHWFKHYKETQVLVQWTEAPERCKWEGEITRIENFDSETHTLAVVVRPIEFIGESEKSFPLVDGMFCKVTFSGKASLDIVKIPWSALQLDGLVYIVDETGKVDARKVDILNSRQDEIIISAGLNEGEEVITQRIPYGVVNGSIVKTVPVEKDSFK